MRVLVLGTGLQGKAALHDLARSDAVNSVVAADENLEDLVGYVSKLDSDKISCLQVDAGDREGVVELMRDVDAVIMLLPPHYGATLAPLAVANNVHWVDASYALPEYRSLGREAAQKGLAILPEFGLDPGIDLLLAAQAIGELDEVHEFLSYGAGIPEFAAADNPLKYRVSWSFAGVLDSYSRPARLIEEGREIVLPATEVFAERNVHMVEIDGLGTLESYPNGDAVRYVEMLGLDRVQVAGRYSMRWPGHAAFWHKFVGLGFLSEEPVSVGNSKLVPRRFVQALLEPQLQYEDNQRDVAIVRVSVSGLKDGQFKRIVYQLVDYRSLDTGLLAMQRTVGYMTSIGVQLILQGKITKRGLLSPLGDVRLQLILRELHRRGIIVHRKAYRSPA